MNTRTNGSGTKRNIVNNKSWYEEREWSISKDGNNKRGVSHSTCSQGSANFLQRSTSADNVIVRTRGFKPSDIRDPAKKHFLENLTSKILHFEMESGEATPVNLQKFLTPAMDTSELLQTKNKKMYASSCFYAPTHPTVEDQVELARRISYSLSDVKNMKSKGDEAEDEPASPVHKDKVPLKCMMNPNGKVLDLHGIQALGEEVNMGTSPLNAEKLFDIVRDLNNQKGRGAEIFAKRRKRSEKWVVDKEQSPASPSTYPKSPNFPSCKIDAVANENSKFAGPTTPQLAPNIDAKPFYNPFTLDLSLEPEMPQKRTGMEQHRNLQVENTIQSGNYTEVKKIYLREVAVGTEPEYGIREEGTVVSNSVEKSKRYVAIEGSSNGNRNGNRRMKQSAPNGYSIGNCNEMTNNGHSRRTCDRHVHYSPPQYHQQQQHHHHHHQPHPHHNNYQQPQPQRYADFGEDIPIDAEYTPVPVKQLIQEFEKTCRPTLQYKRSPKVVPIVQQFPRSPLPSPHHADNDLSRFFESSPSRAAANGSGNDQTFKRNGTIVNGMENGSGKIGNGQMNGNGQMIGNGKMGNGTTMGNGKIGNGTMGNCSIGNGTMGNGSIGNGTMGNGKIGSGCCHLGNVGMPNYEEYDSTEDEIDDSFGDSSSEVNYRRVLNPRILPYDRENGTDRSNSNATSHEYEMYVRQFDESSQLFEAPPGFRDSVLSSCDEGNQRRSTDPQSMVLAMVASQDDILDTLKHLRNTPVLENLIGAPSPDFYADVGNNNNNKLSVDTTYHGPKIASFQTLTNYNTAPRGWDQTQSFYRPVTFGKQQEPIAYSDF